MTLEILEEGGFGLLKNAYHKEKELNIFLKTFDKILVDEFAEIALSDAILEDHILQKVENLKHNDHFLKYYGAFVNPEKLKDNNKLTISALILQKEAGICNLEDIVNTGMIYEKENLKYIISYLVKGFYILQQNGIATRDIKLSNIFLVENKDGNEFKYKVSNFSIGCLLFESVNILGTDAISGCSKMYAAPEVERKFFNKQMKKNIKNEDYDPFRADVYSLGICVLKLMGFANPKKDLEDGLLKKSEVLAKFNDFEKILNAMLCDDFSRRVDFKQLWVLLTGDEEFSFELKPPLGLFIEEKKYYEKWRTEKQRRRIFTSEDLIKLYNEHKQLFEVYHKSVKREKDAQYHLETAWSYLTEFKNKPINTLNGNTDESYEKIDGKEEIFCLKETANVLRKKGEFAQAIDLLRECLIVCDKVYKRTNSFDKDYMINEDYADCYLQLAVNFLGLGKENEAEDNCQQSLNLLRMSFGETNEKTAQAYAVLGEINEKLEEFQKSEEFYLKVLEIQKINLAQNESITANTYNSLGGIYFRQEIPEKAEENYKLALEIMKKIYGTCHPDVAESFLNLAELYKEIWDFEKAEECFNEGMKIYENLYGEKNENIKEIQESLIELYGIMGNIKKKEKKFKEAEEIYNKALKIAQSLNSIYCLVLSENLKNLYLDGILENLEK